MTDHNDRHIGMIPHFLEPFPDDLAIRFIQGARHFIEQEDFWLEKDVAYQGDTLFFSTRQGVDLFIQIFLRQPDRFQICDCFLFIEFLFADFVRKSQIVADGFSEQNRCLECVGNLLAVFGRFVFIQRFPLVAYFPFGTRKDRRNDLQKCALAASGRAGYREKLALFQRIADVIQNDFAVRHKTQMFHFQ